MGNKEKRVIGMSNKIADLNDVGLETTKLTTKKKEPQAGADELFSSLLFVPFFFS